MKKTNNKKVTKTVCLSPETWAKLYAVKEETGSPVSRTVQIAIAEHFAKKENKEFNTSANINAGEEIPETWKKRP